ncbi:MAG: DUF47 domain-containing protein [Acidimicrobiales bacterium]|jgi:uncharacterized protein Yka (UPF0111/DUF47 family)
MRGARSIAHSVARLARDLTGRSTGDLVELLGDQLAWTERGARLVMSMADGSVSTDEARRHMREVEHNGDEARAGLVATLGQVLTTPIDAEDMFRLSRSIDDVLDNLRDFVREVDLYRPLGLDFALPLAETVLQGVKCLRPALGQLDGPRGKARQAALATRKAAGQVRRLYQQKLAELLNQPLDNETLKRRELLRRLDVVGLRLGEAADALADGVLKRSR